MVTREEDDGSVTALSTETIDDHLGLISTRGLKLCRVTIPGCAGEDMVITVCVPLSPARDRYGCYVDAIWRCHVEGTESRYFRMKNGFETLKAFLEKFILFSKEGCLFGGGVEVSVRRSMRAIGTDIDVEFVERDRHPRLVYSEVCEEFPDNIPRCVRSIGIPQKTLRSGLCWWGALWYVLLTPRPLRTSFIQHLDRRAPRTSAAVKSVLKDPWNAELLRRQLWDDFGIGDDPDQAPELDGQNGYTQLEIICNLHQYPIITLIHPYMEKLHLPHTTRKKIQVPRPTAPEAGKPCILGLRCYHSKQCPPERITHSGRTFRLVGGLIGNEHCGHQTALARCGKWWSAYDSDSSLRGIGPISWRNEDAHGDEARSHSAWWSMLDHILPVTSATTTTRFCDMNPRNNNLAHRFLSVALREFRRIKTSNEPVRGKINMDWVYFSDGQDTEGERRRPERIL